MMLRRNDPSQMERENRQNGNQESCKEAREEGCKEEKALTFLQTVNHGDAQASPYLFSANSFSAEAFPLLSPPSRQLRLTVSATAAGTVTSISGQIAR